MSDELGSILEYQETLANAEAPAALPANDYPAEISAAEVVKSASSGKLNVKVTFVIKPEDFPADFEDADSYADGLTLSHYVPAEPDKKARFRMRKFLETIGVKLTAKIDVNDMVGKRAILSTRVEAYEGIDQTRIASVQSE